MTITAMSLPLSISNSNKFSSASPKSNINNNSINLDALNQLFISSSASLNNSSVKSNPESRSGYESDSSRSFSLSNALFPGNLSSVMSPGASSSSTMSAMSPPSSKFLGTRATTTPVAPQKKPHKSNSQSKAKQGKLAKNNNRARRASLPSSAAAKPGSKHIEYAGATFQESPNPSLIPPPPSNLFGMNTPKTPLASTSSASSRASSHSNGNSDVELDYVHHISDMDDLKSRSLKIKSMLSQAPSKEGAACSNVVYKLGMTSPPPTIHSRRPSVRSSHSITSEGASKSFTTAASPPSVNLKFAPTMVVAGHRSSSRMTSPAQRPIVLGSSCSPVLSSCPSSPSFTSRTNVLALANTHSIAHKLRTVLHLKSPVVSS